MDDALIEERHDGVAVLTFNRPEKLNAWSADMAAAYQERLLAAEADPDVRVVVLTGAGRGFCAGADMEGLRRRGDGPTSTSLGGGPSTPLRMGTPVIAAVNGAAAGLGFAIMAMCDVRFAAARRQAHHRLRPPGPGRRVRRGLAAAPPGGPRPRPRPAPVRPGW